MREIWGFSLHLGKSIFREFSQETLRKTRINGKSRVSRRFIPNSSLIAEPLTRLTRKDSKWEWLVEQREAFEILREAFGRDPVLGHFNHRDALALKTDASRVGVAGMLLQQQGDEWRLITCCSRRLSKSEENYGISDLEGLAIVYCVSKLRNYLLGKRFTILTDHCALCALEKKVPNSPRLCWLSIQVFGIYQHRRIQMHQV